MRQVIAILLILFSVGRLFAQRTQDTCVSQQAVRYTIKGETSATDTMKFFWKIRPIEIKIEKHSANFDTIFVKWPKTGNYTLEVYGELDGCQTQTKTLSVIINEAPVITLADKNICEGEKAIFEITDASGLFKSVEWQGKEFGNRYILDTTGIVTAKVTYVNNNCASYDTAQVTVYPRPVVKLGDDISLCRGNSATLDAGNLNASRWLWSTGDSTQTISIKSELSPRAISVMVTNEYENGITCSNTDTIVIRPCDAIFDQKTIPNIITPGTDGHNDKWLIPGISENYPNVTIDIYDRWGRVIFHSKRGYTEPWDGRDLKGQFVPMDSYFYILNFNEKGKKSIVGNITILRGN